MSIIYNQHNRDEIENEQKMLDEFCAKYHFPKHKVKTVASHRDVRVLHAITLPNWELEVLQETGLPHVLERREARPVVKEIIRSFIWPLLEKQYGQPVCYSNFKVVNLNGQYHLFTITIFQNPIADSKDVVVRSLEEKLAGLLAKKLRNLTGRGPKKVKAMLMNSFAIVYMLHGLVSRGEKEFAIKNTRNADRIDKITRYNLNECLSSIHNVNEMVTENICMVDFDNDLTIAIVITDEEQELRLTTEEVE